MSAVDEIEPENSLEFHIWQKESELSKINNAIRQKTQELRKLQDVRGNILEFIRVMKQATNLKRQADSNVCQFTEEEIPTQVIENALPTKRQKM